MTHGGAYLEKTEDHISEKKIPYLSSNKNDVLSETIEIRIDDIKNKNKNKFLLLTEKLSNRSKTIFVIILMTSLNCILGLFPVLLRHFGNNNKTDVVFICLLRSIIPVLFLTVTARIVEGSIFKLPTIKETLYLTFMGIARNGFQPLTSYLISIYIGANYSLIYSQLSSIGVSIGSYFFKLESYPTIKNPGTLLILAGIIISFSSSISVILLNYGKRTDSYEISSIHLTIIIIMGIANIIIFSFFQNYQVARFVKNKNSIFYHKPLSVVASSSLFSMPFLAIGFSISSVFRWDIILPHLKSKEIWILIFFGCFMNGYFKTISTAFCSVLTSPLFVLNMSPATLIFGFIFSYLILQETLSIIQYIFCAFILIGVVVLIIGKHLSSNKKKLEV